MNAILQTVLQSEALRAACERMLAILADGAVKGLIVLGLAALVAFGLRRATAAARHLVWALALGGLVALPFFSLLVPQWEIGLLPRVSGAERSAVEPAPSHATTAFPASSIRQSGGGPAVSPMTTAGTPSVINDPGPAAPSMAKLPIPPVTQAVGVWLLGVLLALLPMLLGHAGAAPVARDRAVEG